MPHTTIIDKETHLIQKTDITVFDEIKVFLRKISIKTLYVTNTLINLKKKLFPLIITKNYIFDAFTYIHVAECTFTFISKTFKRISNYKWVLITTYRSAMKSIIDLYCRHYVDFCIMIQLDTCCKSLSYH